MNVGERLAEGVGDPLSEPAGWRRRPVGAPPPRVRQRVLGILRIEAMQIVLERIGTIGCESNHDSRSCVSHARRGAIEDAVVILVWLNRTCPPMSQVNPAASTNSTPTTGVHGPRGRGSAIAELMEAIGSTESSRPGADDDHTTWGTAPVSTDPRVRTAT
jgi:hypothetical protein